MTIGWAENEKLQPRSSHRVHVNYVWIFIKFGYTVFAYHKIIIYYDIFNESNVYIRLTVGIILYIYIGYMDQYEYS